MAKLSVASIVVAFGVVAGNALASETHRIAYSSKDKVAILVPTSGGSWCRNDLALTFAYDADSNSTDVAAIQSLMRKVGAVIEQECPEAFSANITARRDNEMVGRFVASKAGAWAPIQLSIGLGPKNGPSDRKSPEVTAPVMPSETKKEDVAQLPSDASKAEGGASSAASPAKQEVMPPAQPSVNSVSVAATGSQGSGSTSLFWLIVMVLILIGSGGAGARLTMSGRRKGPDRDADNKPIWWWDGHISLPDEAGAARSLP